MMEKRMDFFQSLYDETPQLVVVLDDKLKPVDCNASAIKCLGCDSKEEALANMHLIVETVIYQSGERHSFSMEEHLHLTIKYGADEFGATLSIREKNLPLRLLPLWIVMKKIPAGDSFVIAIYGSDLHKMTAAKEIIVQNRLYKIIHEHIAQLETAVGKSFDRAATDFLGALGACIQVNRATIWENYTDDGHFCCRQLYEWLRDAVPTMGWKITKRTFYDDIPDLRDALTKNKIISDILRNRPKSEQEYLDGQGIKSLLVIPIFIKGEFWGWMDFEDCEKERFFDGEEQQVLHFSGLLLGASILRNITTAEFKKALTRKVKTAESENSAKSQFLASMSHEIRTPMNAIIGMGEIIRTDNFDETQKNYFNDIRKMSKTLLGIINDILDISKIEAGKMELVPVHFDLAEVFDIICSMNKFIAASKSLTFKQHFADDVPHILYGDEQRTQQVILNLVNNAIKYTREGYVSLDISRAVKNNRDCVVITVTDTGIGIRTEDIPKLFDTFQQLDARKNRGIVGTGLGLAIVKNILDLMDGIIEVKSTYGKGSVFTAWLPLTEGDPNKIVRDKNIPKIIAASDTRVLVVDDNSINLTVALGFLATHNIKADTALSGPEALEKVKAVPYDIVFMDHMMPEMDGTEAAMLIRALPGKQFKTMPIVALSANAVQGTRELFLNSGMNDFLAKPIEACELNRILATWLPPEKIAETARAKETGAGEPATFTPILTALYGISALDVDAGLSHVGGNTGAYIDILRQFCTEFDGFIEEIRRFCGKNDWKEYSIRLHAMKGMFANIGVEDLRAWAYKLELASKNNETEVCRAETEAICNAMTQFRDKLMGTPLMATAAASKAKHTEGPGYLREKLAALKEACSKGDSDTACAIAAELETAHIAGGTDKTTETILKRIAAAVASFDFDKVIEDIDRL